MEELNFNITTALRIYHGEKAVWHFLSIEDEEAAQVKFFTDPANTGKKRRGWGAVKVKATIGDTTWETGMFPSKDTGGYFLPIKKQVRTAEKLLVDSEVTINLIIKTGL